MASKKPESGGPQSELSGAFCVAFVNTAGARPENTQLGVESYADLVTWGQQTGVVSTLEAQRLRRRASQRPDEAEAALAQAVRIRSLLCRLFAAVAQKKDMPNDDLAAFNTAWVQALSALRVVPAEKGLAWGWEGEEDALDRMLWPVLHSAAELLVSIQGRPQIRQCAGKHCLLWFVDRTPSQKRRWCAKTCGRRAKALRYYYKTAKDFRDKKMRGSGEWRTRRPRRPT